MAIYQRGNNWYIDFTFKGQRVRESIGPSKKDAKKVIGKKKTEIIENKYLDIRKDPDPIKFHDFAKEYLQWAKANKKPSSYVRDFYIMRIFDKEFEGKNIGDITTWQIEKFKTERKKVVKPASVNRELAVLKGFFTKAVKWGRCKEHPAKEVKLFKGVSQRLRYLMPDEVQRLILNCAKHIKPIVTVAVHTGMRRGELLSLRWDQINFERGIITILDTKNSEKKNIPMDDTVRNILQGLEEKNEQKNEFVFPSSKAKPFDPMVVHKAFHKALDQSGITDFRFHDLRDIPLQVTLSWQG